MQSNVGTKYRTSQSGFTLVEIAIVLAIITILLGGMLAPLGSAREQILRKQTDKQLSMIRESLLGFAASHRRLPCPASHKSGGEEVFQTGSSSDGGECKVTHGFIPATTLALSGPRNEDALLIDSWGNPFRYSVGGGSADESEAVTLTNGIAEQGMPEIEGHFTICQGVVGGCSGKIATQVPAVFFSMGGNWNLTDSSLQKENAGESALGKYPIANDVHFVSTEYSQVAGKEYDDMIYWISENVLFTRLIEAGVLP